MLSGHGAADAARVGAGDGSGLEPEQLLLPDGCGLYLLACYQGRPEVATEWSTTADWVLGTPGDADTAFSALFFAGLETYGVTEVAH